MKQYKTCIRCLLSEPHISFALDKSRKDGKQVYCRNCFKMWREANKDKVKKIKKTWYENNKLKQAASKKNYREANKNKKKIMDAAWRKANPQARVFYEQARRARKALSNNKLVTIKDVRRLLMKPCIYCGQPSEQIDHIMPLSRGGDHSIGNIIGACKKCNLSKNNKTIMEWRIWKLRLGL